MADDATPAPAQDAEGAQQNAAAAAATEDRPKDTRSFEERIAELKKPAPVPQPDEDKYNKLVTGLNAKIEACNKQLTDIKAALEKASSTRDGSKSESKTILDQLKAIRVRIKTASQEREALYQQQQALTAARQAQQKSLQEMRKNLKYEDVKQVEAKVAELEQKISHGQCADLKEEKKVMMEIKQLNATKSQIAAFLAQQRGVVDDSEQKADLDRRRAEATARLDAAKKEAEVLDKQLKDLQAKQQAENPTNTNDLWKKQNEIYTQIKEYRAEVRKVNMEYKEEINKYRDFQKLNYTYKKQLQRIQAEQRKAEYEARKKEAEGPIDADLPSDDPLVGHPWADEILLCKDLEKLLSSFLPKEVKAEAKEEEKEKTWLKGAAGKMSGKDESDPFADLAVSKKSKTAKKAAPVNNRLVLGIDTITSLSTIGVPIPTTADQVASCLEKLGEKKKAFMEMTEEQKKEAKAKAGGGRGEAKHGGGGGGGGKSELAVVNITCTAPDKVSVNIEYPALSASA